MNWERMTLPVLLAQWARTVDYLERQPVTTEEFVTEVLLRHEIAKRLQTQPVTRETRDLLAEIDEHFRTLTEEQTGCTLSPMVTDISGWTPVREWYAWRRPREA